LNTSDAVATTTALFVSLVAGRQIRPSLSNRISGGQAQVKGTTARGTISAALGRQTWEQGAPAHGLSAERNNEGWETVMPMILTLGSLMMERRSLPVYLLQEISSRPLQSDQ
jgi:hypothetical protein